MQIYLFKYEIEISLFKMQISLFQIDAGISFSNRDISILKLVFQMLES